MPKKTDYQCVRCGYCTDQKCRIKRHFYELKKQCPSIINNIELTEDIKTHIITNRIYHIEKKVEPSIINNNQNILTIITELSNIEKINKYLSHQGQCLIGFGDQIEKQNIRRIQGMENDTYKYGFRLEESDFLDLVDKSVHVEDTSQMNLLFVQELNKISLYHDDAWESYLMDAGINKIITILRDYYLATYEKYVIDKLYDTHIDAYTRSKYRVQLESLYKFYAYFDVDPYSRDKDNNEISNKYSHENERHLAERCEEIYMKIKKDLTKTEINSQKRQIITIIKKNTQVNLKNLNKSILNLANIDEDFKAILTDNEQVVTKFA